MSHSAKLIFLNRNKTDPIFLFLVPEAPVEVSVSPPSQETDLILRNLGNFPIDIRQRGSHKGMDAWMDDWMDRKSNRCIDG